MRKNCAIYGIVMVTMLLIPSTLFGAGFALYEGSARGNGLGGLTGSADDPSALFFNPAGITQLEGSHFMGGATIIIPFGKFATRDTLYDPLVTENHDYADNVFTPPHIYYTRQMNDKLWLGGAVYSRFGLGTEFDPDWPGRYSNINTLIESVSFAANVAYKVNDMVSLSLGISAMWFDVSLESAIDATVLLAEPHNNTTTNRYDAVQKLEGNAWGYGYNASIHYMPSDRWSFAVSYVSEVEQEIKDATARFTKPTASVPSTWFVDTNVDGEPIDLPSMLSIGFNWQATERMALEVGYIRTGWSSIERLQFNYDQPIIVAPGLGQVVQSAGRQLDWEDATRLNFGIEFDVNDSWDLWFGATFDETPVPDETISYLLPTNDRELINLGFRKVLDKWTVDFAFNYLILNDRRIQYDNAATQAERQLADGVLNTYVHDSGAYLIALSAGRKF